MQVSRQSACYTQRASQQTSWLGRFAGSPHITVSSFVLPSWFLWTRDALTQKTLLFGCPDYMLGVSKWGLAPQAMHEESTWRSLYHFTTESWTPCVSHTSRTWPGESLRAFRVFYESCGLDQVRHSQGTTERVRRLQIVRIRLPRGPFYNRNSHLLEDIQVLDTTWSRCTQCKVALNRYLYTNQSQLV